MKGHCQFLRTISGRSYFARVELEIQLGGETVEVVDALPERVNQDDGLVNRKTSPGWVSAVLEGMRASLSGAQQSGALVTGCRAVLQELVGSVIDTQEDVIRCAAGLAVWDALGQPELAPQAEFEDQNWKLVFPAGTANRAQKVSRR